MGLAPQVKTNHKVRIFTHNIGIINEIMDVGFHKSNINPQLGIRIKNLGFEYIETGSSAKITIPSNNL